jgi:LPS-assembly lipoprotein
MLINILGSDGRESGKLYHLKISLTATNQGVALQNDATITRYNDTLTVNYTLRDTKGAEVTHGTQTSLSSYNVVSSPYATLSAQQDADKRAAQDIAERIRIDLGAFFRRRDLP